MKPLVSIYMIRLSLGLIAGVIGAFIIAYSEPILNPSELTTLLNGLTIALVIYLLSYYLIKAKFYNLVEKRSKIMTTGIGMFFISWIIFLTLTYTLLIG